MFDGTADQLGAMPADSLRLPLLWEERAVEALLWWPGSWVLIDGQGLGRPR